MIVFFFFKQKTAYEMRISDWRSDVCSSDLHAASLLNIGLVRVASLQVSQASLDLVSAPWLERKKRERPLLHYEFEHYQTYLERKHAFQVLQSSAAKCGVLAEIARIARVSSSKIETGGLMFGEIDDSHRHIWIDEVSGPPPHREASCSKFLCGMAGTNTLARLKHRTNTEEHTSELQ